MAGRRRHKLALETRTETLDAYGEATLTYAKLADAWGSVEAVSGTERVESQQVQAEVSHRIKIRYSTSYATLGPDDRVTYGTRTFDIVSIVDKTGKSSELEITALERL